MVNEVEFGLIVKKIRLANKQTIADVSQMSGISTSQISRIEKGQRGLPKPEMLMKLSKGLKVPYEELMEKAGYLKNLTNDELDAVKELFKSHRIVDELLKSSLARLRDEDGFRAEIIEQLVGVIEEFMSEESYEEEVPFSFYELLSYIDKVDLDIDRKLILLERLNTIVTPIAKTQTIEITKLDNYVFSIDGKFLDESTQEQLKAVLRAVLKV